jgi:hypothetical protein
MCSSVIGGAKEQKKRTTKIDQNIPLSSSSAKQRRLTARKKALKNAS